MIYVSVDLETTGIDPKNCQIIEFGAVLDDLANPKPLAELPFFHAYILPQGKSYSGEPMALSFHADIFRKIAGHMEDKGKSDPSEFTFLRPNELGKHFYKFLHKNLPSGMTKVTPAGKNFASFDLSFLLEVEDFQKHVGLERADSDASISLRKRCIDPSVFFWQPGDESLPDTKTCLRRAGISTEPRHTALEDALSVVELVRAGAKKLWPLTAALAEIKNP